MKNILLFCVAILCFTAANGQNKSVIKEQGITAVKTYEQRLDKGIDDKYIIEQVKYNAAGKIIERKEQSRKGEIKLWEKYKYDTNGNLTEELTLDIKGEVSKKIVTKYKNNLKLSREYYNSEGRLYKKKTYEYEFK